MAAQTTPDAGSLLRQQEQSQPRPPRVLPDPEVEAGRPPLQVQSDVTVQVKGVRFSGATELIPAAELQALVADAIGKELDFAALQELAERVTREIKKRGWFLGRAYLPKQDITDGTIEIVLLAGRLSEREPVRITPSGKLAMRIAPARLEAMADQRLKPGGAANEDDLNRTVLLMNDLPGLRARALLEPGDSPDTTRINIAYEEGPLLTSSLTLDNHGSRDTGLYQINASANLNDPLGQGDQFGAGITHADGMKMARLSYSLPIGYDGLKLNLGVTTMDYKVITPTGRLAGLAGDSTTLTAGLTYPWFRSRTANRYVSLTYADKEMTDTSSAGIIRDKSVQSANLTLSGDFLDTYGGGGSSNWNVAATTGMLHLNISTDAAADAAAFRSAGRYEKINVAFSRLQKLPGAFTLNASLSGQSAAKNLDSSEKFIAGGPNGVRAYPGSEGSADEGLLANLELRYDWPESGSWGNLQIQAFYDTAHVRLHKDLRDQPISTASGANSYQIAGAGLGATLSQPGRYYLRAIWAARVGTNPGRSTLGMDADGRKDSSRFWLQGLWWF